MWDLVLRKDRVRRAWVDAGTAVNAFAGIDEVLMGRVTRVNAIDWAHLYAGGIFDPDTRLHNYERHDSFGLQGNNPVKLVDG